MGKTGAAAGDLLLLIAQNFDVLALPLVSLAYPLYASIRAIETKNVADDRQFLTYWVLYSLITLFELTFDRLIEWIPLWSYVKLIVTCWLVMPQFSGAAYVYEHYVRPFYTGDQTMNVWYHVPPQKKDVFIPLDPHPHPHPQPQPQPQPLPLDETLVAAHKYIHQYTPDAYQEFIPAPCDYQEIRYRGAGGGFFPEYDNNDNYADYY